MNLYDFRLVLFQEGVDCDVEPKETVSKSASTAVNTMAMPASTPGLAESSRAGPDNTSG